MKRIDFENYISAVNLLRQNDISVHSIRITGDIIYIIIDSYEIPSNILGAFSELFKYKLYLCSIDGESMFKLKIIE